MDLDLDLFSACFCIEESTPLLRLLGALSQKSLLLLWRARCRTGAAVAAVYNWGYADALL